MPGSSSKKRVSVSALMVRLIPNTEGRSDPATVPPDPGPEGMKQPHPGPFPRLGGGKGRELRFEVDVGFGRNTEN